MTTTKATVTQNRGSYTRPLMVRTPGYDVAFVALARSLKGEWSPVARAWFFGPITARLFNGLVSLYGADAISWCEDPAPLCTTYTS